MSYTLASCKLVSKFNPYGAGGKANGYKYMEGEDRVAYYDAGNLRVATGDINLIDPVLLGRYAALVKDKHSKGATGVGFITYGYRSFSEQEELFFNGGGKKNSDGTYSKPSSWVGGTEVATPGFSTHEYGLAIDVSDPTIRSLKNSDLKPYGLYKRLSSENWHIEPIEVSNWASWNSEQRKNNTPTNLKTASFESTAKAGSDGSGGKTLEVPVSKILYDLKTKMLDRGYHRHMISSVFGTIEKECGFIAREINLNYKTVKSVRNSWSKAKDYTDSQISSFISAGPKTLGEKLIDGGYAYRGRGYVQITGKATYTAVNDRLSKYTNSKVDILKEPDKLITDYETAVSATLCVLEFNLNQVGEIAYLSGSGGKAGIDGLITACNSSTGMLLSDVAWYVGGAILGPGNFSSGKTPSEHFKWYKSSSHSSDLSSRAKNASFYHQIYDLI